VVIILNPGAQHVDVVLVADHDHADLAAAARFPPWCDRRHAIAGGIALHGIAPRGADHAAVDGEMVGTVAPIAVDESATAIVSLRRFSRDYFKANHTLTPARAAAAPAAQ
jgi:hypothetical protein